MDGALVAAWKLLEIKCEVASITGTSPPEYGGVAQLQFTDTVDDSSIRTAMQLDSSSNSISGWSNRLQIPDLSYDQTWSGATFPLLPILEIEIDDWHLYAMAGQFWRIVGGDVRIYSNSSLVDTISGGFVIDSPYLKPAMVPWLGLPPSLYGGPIYLAPVITKPTGSDSLFETDMRAVARGGYRFDDAIETTDPPVVYDPLSPSGACSCAGTYPGIVADSTWDAEVEGVFLDYLRRVYVGRVECHCPPGVIEDQTGIFDLWDYTRAYEARTGRVWLLPGYKPQVLRGNDEYRALIHRGGFPEVEHVEAWTCEENGVSDSGEVRTHERDSLDATVRTVRNAAHPIEAAFGLSAKAPYELGTTKNSWTSRVAETIQEGLCRLPGGHSTTPPDPCWDDVDLHCINNSTAVFPVVEDSTSNPDLIAFYDHDEDLVRYINFSANPHWHHHYQFPEDGTGTQWPVDGTDETADDYWGKVREQWIHWAGLPAGEDSKTRNSVISAPLLQGFSDHLRDDVVGFATQWWGIGRLVDTEAFSPATSKTLTSGSSAAWSTTGGTPSFGGANITVTPSGAGTVTLDYDLGRFAEAPYLYPHIARQITVGWNGPNVTGFRVKLVNGAGDSVTLLTSSATSGTPTLDKASATDSKFAGTWGQDWGCGAVTDTGSDIGGAGESTTVLASPERVLAFGYLAHLTPAKLRIEVDVSSAAAFTLNYPIFLKAGTWGLMAESGQCASVLNASGPGIHWGQQRWDDGAGASLATPTIRAIGAPPTIVDWLCLANVLLDGQDRATDLAARLSVDLFDSVTGDTIADVADETLAFLAAGTSGVYAMMLNSYQTPPLAQVPYRTLDSSDWSDDAYGIHATSWVLGPRYYIAPITPALYDGSGNLWTAPIGGAPAGWALARHDREVDNNEGVTFKIRVGGTDYANCSPWHGYFMNVGEAAVGTGRHMVADMNQGCIYIVRFGEGSLDLIRRGQYGTEGFTIGALDVTSAQIAWHPWGWLHVAYCEGGTCKLITSKGNETQWSSPVTIDSGTVVAEGISLKSGCHLIALYDGGDWTCYRRWQPTGTFETLGVITAGLEFAAGLEFDPAALDGWYFSCATAGGDKLFRSPDNGSSWSEV